MESVQERRRPDLVAVPGSSWGGLRVKAFQRARGDHGGKKPMMKRVRLCAAGSSAAEHNLLGDRGSVMAACIKKKIKKGLNGERSAERSPFKPRMAASKRPDARCSQLAAVESASSARGRGASFSRFFSRFFSIQRRQVVTLTPVASLTARQVIPASRSSITRARRASL